MKREPIVFIIVLMILGIKASSLFSEKVPSGRIRQGVKQLELQSTGSVDLVAQLASADGGRDLFLRPSADQPLAALEVPFPELPAPSILLPPPLPNPGTHVQSLNLFVRPFSLDGLMSAVDSSATDDLDDFADGIEIDGEQQYGTEFDYIRINAITTFYGRIVSEDRYRLSTGDALLFVEYDVDTGSERYGVRPFAGDEYQAFGFAETLHNKIELDYLSELRGMSAGSLSKVAVFIDWLLANGMSEPIAFDYAKVMALKSAQLAPDDGSNWLQLAKTYEATLEYDQAFSIYALMVGDAISGDFVDTLVQSGLSPKRFAHMSAPRVAMGKILQKFGLATSARDQFEMALEVSDGSSFAPMALGNSMLHDGLYTAARENLQRAFNKQANRSSQMALQNGLDLGLAMLAQQDWPAAIDQFATTESLAVDKLAVIAQARAGQIAALYLSGDFANAQATAEQAVMDSGATAQLLYMRGITTGANGGNATSVISDLEAAVAAQPLNAADYLAALAFFNDAAGDQQAAEVALASALEQSPLHVYARYLQAFMAARNGDLLGAQQGYEDLVKDNPDCAALLAAYAALLSEQGDYAKANVAFMRIDEQLNAQTKSTTSAAAWANVHLRQGVNLLNLSRHDAALSAFDYALSLDSTLHAARNSRAITMYVSDELDMSVAEFSYLQDALRDDLENEQYLYAQLWQLRLQEHDRLRRWTDDFSDKRLRPGWDLQNGARAGIAPRHQDQALIIEGQHEAAARTSVSRSVPGIAFRSFDSDLTIGANHRGSAGVAIALMNRSKKTWSFEVERNREGQLSYSVSRGTRVESENLSMSVAVGVPMNVRYSLDREPKQPVLTVRVNNQVVYSAEVVALRNPTGQMTSSFYAKTAHALPVDISLDNVELIYAQIK
ncbi:MAG: tetratricopeptide (TPR) repeat protein [Myxococcota bacterium]|jgi:tetratricopeptide (TPR) repeat protein